MRKRLPLQGTTKLVFTQCVVFYTDKGIFLRPLFKGPLPFYDIATGEKIQVCLIFTDPTLPRENTMKKTSLTCPACHQQFHHRAKRNWFVKHLLCFLPFKVYFCKCCDKDVYILFQQPQQMHTAA